MKKNKQLNIRVRQEELDLIDSNIKDFGYDNRSEYLMSLLEKDSVIVNKHIDITEVEKININLSKLYELNDTNSEQNLDLIKRQNDIFVKFMSLQKDMFLTKKMLTLILAYLKSNFKQSNTKLNDESIKDTMDFIEAKEIEFNKKYL